MMLGFINNGAPARGATNHDVTSERTASDSAQPTKKKKVYKKGGYSKLAQIHDLLESYVPEMLATEERRRPEIYTRVASLEAVRALGLGKIEIVSWFKRARLRAARADAARGGDASSSSAIAHRSSDSTVPEGGGADDANNASDGLGVSGRYSNRLPSDEEVASMILANFPRADLHASSSYMRVPPNHGAGSSGMSTESAVRAFGGQPRVSLHVPATSGLRICPDPLVFHQCHPGLASSSTPRDLVDTASERPGRPKFMHQSRSAPEPPEPLSRLGPLSVPEPLIEPSQHASFSVPEPPLDSLGQSFRIARPSLEPLGRHGPLELPFSIPEPLSAASEPLFLETSASAPVFSTPVISSQHPPVRSAAERSLQRYGLAVPRVHSDPLVNPTTFGGVASMGNLTDQQRHPHMSHPSVLSAVGSLQVPTPSLAATFLPPSGPVVRAEASCTSTENETIPGPGGPLVHSDSLLDYLPYDVPLGRLTPALRGTADQELPAALALTELNMHEPGLLRRSS